jgi:hypothetical protein
MEPPLSDGRGYDARLRYVCLLFEVRTEMRWSPEKWEILSSVPVSDLPDEMFYHPQDEVSRLPCYRITRRGEDSKCVAPICSPPRCLTPKMR